jgi:hypothetical protein
MATGRKGRMLMDQNPATGNPTPAAEEPAPPADPAPETDAVSDRDLGPAKFTDAAPTGKSKITADSTVMLGAVVRHLNVDLGEGQVSTLDAFTFNAAGQYSVNSGDYEGTWTISVVSADNGQTWKLTFQFGGTVQYEKTGTARAIRSGSGHDTAVTYSFDDNSQIKQYYQTAGLVQKAKIWFDIPEIATGSAVLGSISTLYLYPVSK